MPQTTTPHPEVLTTLTVLERYYDAAPRPLATTEEVGPFTLFVRRDPAGWPYYARPRLGLAEPVGAADVRRLLDRERELGVPRALEWVQQTTPTLLAAARDAGMSVEECPLLVLPGAGTPPGWVDTRPVTTMTPPGLELRVLDADDPDLGRVAAAVHAGFGGTDEVAAPDAGNQPEQLRRGLLRVVGAFLDGQVVGGGSHGPRRDTTELAGIAVLPRARRLGIGGAVTAALVADAQAHGIRQVFLSAQDDAVARVYERVGFRRVGTACVAELPPTG
ncbi:MAG TPA: GNAT family N-acetyltransferase [Segeticoccus sp.]|uniref:GNAT family N-acetyltransferase n=1 Tax=Segeticoccus sp. TaxID=2706531 RepID=UPI002D7F35D5|nr:GNAT family N-acetyltransferase [Segeticoccus sp.]HET8601096.1 GNAT family N-acetyltransferase [Segeticoccus sp.]